MRKSEAIKDGEGVVDGHTAKIKVVKNKLAPPFRTAEFDLLYGKGFDRYSDLLNVALHYGVFTAKGSWISHGEDRVGQGKKQSAAVLESDPELYAKIRNEVIIKAFGA